MAERSYFWNTAGGGDGAVYTQTELMDYFFRAVLNGNGDQGVLRAWRNELEVTGTASPVTIASGGAILHGMFFENDSAVTITIPTPASGTTRTDLIVVRRDWGAQTCRIYHIQGPGAALTQAAGTIWDIPLASVSVTDAGVVTVTDSRECCALGTEFPLLSIDTAEFGELIEPAAIADRTRVEVHGAGRIGSDDSWTDPTGSFYCWDISKPSDGFWTYYLVPIGTVNGAADVYVWNTPSNAVALDQYVAWNCSVYQCQEGLASQLVDYTETLVNQNGRAVNRFYCDRVAHNVNVLEGLPVIVLLERYVAHESPSLSPSSSVSPSISPSPSLSPSASESPSGSPSLSPSASFSPSSSESPSLSPSSSSSPSSSISPSESPSLSPSSSLSPSASFSPSSSESPSLSPSSSISPSASFSPSKSPSLSPSSSVSPSESPSESPSPSPPWEDTYPHNVYVWSIEMRRTADC